VAVYEGWIIYNPILTILQGTNRLDITAIINIFQDRLYINFDYLKSVRQILSSLIAISDFSLARVAFKRENDEVETEEAKAAFESSSEACESSIPSFSWNKKYLSSHASHEIQP
jgi:hypothetical protein